MIRKTFPLLALLLITTATAQIKVACVGDSITQGAGIASPKHYAYPAQLQHLLGNGYEVKNFGVSGRTLLTHGDHPYIKEKAYQDSLRFQADIVIIKLGTNDSKPHNWKHQQNFLKDLKNLIASYRTTGKAKRVILCKPIPVVQTRWGINEKTLRDEIGPLIEQAATGNIEIVDLHIALRDKHQHIPDKIHPNSFGAEVIARHLHRYLTAKRDPGFSIQIPKGQQRFRYHGFDGSTFPVGPIQAKIIRPKFAAQDTPWIWRQLPIAKQSEFDIQMLELGYHIVYSQPGTLNNDSNCYSQSQQWKLNPKPILFSSLQEWANKNPNRIAGIINKEKTTPLTDQALKFSGKYTNPAALPAPSAEYRGGPAGWGGGTWWNQHEKINQLARQNKDLELIFLGDSITQSWTGSRNRLGNPQGKRPIDRHFATKNRCASFGISGDRTEHLLFRIQNGNFDGLNPKHVVIMIGVNNIIGGGHQAEDIAPGIRKVAETLSSKLPDTNIILLGPLPTAHQPDAPRRLTCNKIHDLLATYTFPKNVRYHNISKTFLNPDGTLNKKLYSGDGIHLRRPGYETWAKVLKPLLD